MGASLAQMLNVRTGCTVMGWGSHFAARSVYTKVPVNALAGLKGVKLRVLPTTAFIDTFKLMGAVPTPIPFNELYTAVQTGVVDGFEHDASTVLATKLYEVTKHCFLTEHLFPPMVAVVGKRGLEKIPRKGTLIAEDGDRPILTPYDDCILVMPSRRLTPGQTAVRLGRLDPGD